MNGYYTLAIEVSFAIIERSMEYYVGSRGQDPDMSSHRATFSNAAATGLITDEQSEQFRQLWGRYRNENYYDTGTATERRAETMQSLAETVHSQAVELTQGAENVCTCE